MGYNQQIGYSTQCGVQTVITAVALLLGMIAMGVGMMLFAEARSRQHRRQAAYDRVVRAAEKSRLLAEETRNLAIKLRTDSGIEALVESQDDGTSN
jgi:hypothetical protein